MNQVTLIPVIKHYVTCPHCGKQAGSVDHLFNDGEERSFGSWCHDDNEDDCGGWYRGIVKGKAVFVEKDEAREVVVKRIAFLRNGNILLAVRHDYDGVTLDEDHMAYYYNEHTCPTNYMDEVDTIIDLKEKDTDPHGIFQYVGNMLFSEWEKIKDDAGVITKFVKQLEG